MVVEADTPDAAVAVLRDRYGTRFTVEDITSIRRGGVGGFFARERVEVRARVDQRGAELNLPGSCHNDG